MKACRRQNKGLVSLLLLFVRHHTHICEDRLASRHLPYVALYTKESTSQYLTDLRNQASQYRTLAAQTTRP